jgi:hypothetical protein
MNFGVYPHRQVAGRPREVPPCTLARNRSGICMLLHSHRSDLVDAHILSPYFSTSLPRGSNKGSPSNSEWMPSARFGFLIQRAPARKHTRRVLREGTSR